MHEVVDVGGSAFSKFLFIKHFGGSSDWILSCLQNRIKVYPCRA